MYLFKRVVVRLAMTSCRFQVMGECAGPARSPGIIPLHRCDGNCRLRLVEGIEQLLRVGIRPFSGCIRICWQLCFGDGLGTEHHTCITVCIDGRLPGTVPAIAV